MILFKVVISQRAHLEKSLFLNFSYSYIIMVFNAVVRKTSLMPALKTW